MGQIVSCLHDLRKLPAGQIQLHGTLRAGGQKDSVVSVDQLIQRDIPFKGGVQANDGVGLLLQLLGQPGQQLARQDKGGMPQLGMPPV